MGFDVTANLGEVSVPLVTSQKAAKSAITLFFFSTLRFLLTLLTSAAGADL